MWTQPPGGFTPRQQRRRRIRRLQGAGLALVVLASALVATRSALTRSAPVSRGEVLETYRRQAAAESSEASRTKRRPSVSRRAPARPRAARRSSRPGPMAARSVSTAPIERRTVRTSPARSESGKQTEATRPEEGVYTWNIDGYEEASGGMRRELPKRSHRMITHARANGWVEHHVFSEQREQWFELDRSDAGFSTSAVRNRVEFGPVEVDRTVVFTPPVRGARAPFRVNETWSGSWRGRTSGEYTARIFEHTTLLIGGERVEVWGSQVEMHMRGEVEGDVLTRSWIAPDLGLVVKQYQRMSAESGPGSYRSEWTGQLSSLDPSS